MMHTEQLTVARVHLRAGAIVPRHEHHNEQVANVLTGRLRFLVDGEEVDRLGRQSIAIPADVRTRSRR